MSSNPAVPDPAGAPEVMASIDADGTAPRLIIADVSADGRWLSIPAGEAPSLSEWR